MADVPAPPHYHRIVLTGGPGAGKSVVSRLLAERYPGRLVVVAEAATQVYHAMRTRWDRLDPGGRRDVQRRIYRLQIEQESAAAAAHPDRVLLLDRGTVDGAAYWPEGPDGYWADLGTSAAAELARYDAVLWLETAAALGIYDGEASNAVRFEAADAAVASGQALARLWASHRRFSRVVAYPTFDAKLAAVDRALADAIAAQ